MILIGQYDSPFVRRTAIAMRYYGFDYEHRPWSVYGDADKVAAYNPLLRVPTLVLDDGEVLIESTLILDYLDEVAGPARALLPQSGPDRRHALKICALATGLAEKGLSLLYELLFHQDRSQSWVTRCRTQIASVQGVLEAESVKAAGRDWYGAAMGHADIAVACALRFVSEAHPGIFLAEDFPALAARVARYEALPIFREIAQPLRPPPAAS